MTTSEETRMTRAPAPALSSAEAARVAAFDAAPTPPECDPERVESVARALWVARDGEGSGLAWDDKRVSDLYRSRYRKYAAAAIAALPPSPAEEAVKAVLTLIDPASEMATGNGYDGARWFSERDLRAALASPAPAPQGGEGS